MLELGEGERNMPKKVSTNKSKTPKRWEFNTTSDILEFESEMEEKVMSEKESKDHQEDLIYLKKLGYKPAIYNERTRSLWKNTYYMIKERKYYIIEDKEEAASLMSKKEIIPAIQMLARNNNIARGITSLEPIIFERKGKTPPSVPYLKVSVTSDIEGDLTPLHQIHSKVRKSK